jgi:uncharacterized protein YbjQ (UPF0145 family)
MSDFIGVISFFLLLIIGYISGKVIEGRHFRELAKREFQYNGLLLTSLKSMPADWEVVDSGLVMGGVVVSVDFFKMVASGVRGIFGGRLRAYEPLLERGRREALQRLREVAVSRGYNALINVRFDTAPLTNKQGNQGLGGVELFVYGTGIRTTN